ncbi:MAG: NnrU family protein [Rhizobium sp.]|nr:NnrU family protein [Rhizobium sp.]
MTNLLIALGVFLALHSVPAIAPIRAGAIAVLGRRTYLGLYSLISVLVLAWVFQAALTTDYIPLWQPAGWQAKVTLVTAPIGVFLVLAGLASANPLSITLRQDARPGAITTVTRHPVLWGFLFWSLGHLVPNGDLRSLILFGGLALFTVSGFALLDRRARKRLADRWEQMSRASSLLPFAAVLSGRNRLRVDGPLLLSALLATAITAWLLLGGHALLFGADPLLATSF